MVQSLAQAQAGRVSAVSAAANPYAAQAAALTAAYGQQQGLQTGSAKALTQTVNVKFKNLPFYDIHGDLLKPTSLVTQGKRVLFCGVFSRIVTEESLSSQEVPGSRRLSSSSC